jgi:3-keto-disaccharide hydrolase
LFEEKKAVIDNVKDKNDGNDFVKIFDGTLDGWKMAGKGGFAIVFEGDRQQQQPLLKTQGGMGLLWYCKKKFKDFVLKLEWKVTDRQDNSGVFVRFPNPNGDPWVAVNNGYEIQIDDLALPDGNPVHLTGAMYSFMRPTKVASKPVGNWNNLVIITKDQKYTAIINNETVIKDFLGNRAKEGYIGLQNHDVKSTVYFRNIAIKEIL